MRPPLPRRGFPAHAPAAVDDGQNRLEPCAPDAPVSRDGCATSAPSLVLSDHALQRCAEREVSPADLAMVAASPTFLTRQADGTVRVSGVISGTHSRWFVEAIVWIVSVSHWFVLTVWRSGLRAPKARGKGAA
jgi:hypothetical protein